jgi:NAD(P)-dependent dehydrogenase (short-subunit alcohol dehydrogenase family)
MKLKDAIVLVTGANRGLGKSLVQANLEAGARRVYAGARNPAQLAAMVSAAQGRVVPLALDITNEDSLRAAAARAEDITILYNNAGILTSDNVLASRADQIAQEFTTNFFGMLSATRAFLPALERGGAVGPAALVNVLSVVSLANMPALGAYSAAKAAAFSITQALRGDLARRGISVHAVLPGAIDTDMIRAFDMPKTSPDDVAREIVAGVEQDRAEILPDPISREMFALWQRDPLALARQLAGAAAA